MLAEPYQIENCIQWNEEMLASARIQLRDRLNQLTEERKLGLEADVIRYQANIKHLQQHL